MRALAWLLLPVLLCAGCGPTGYLEREGRIYWASYPGNSAFPTLERVEREIEADPASFRIEAFAEWASDRDHVFYKGRVLGRVDQPSFSARSAELAADRYSVWLNETSVEGADPASFRLLDHRYAVDDRRAYYGATPFEACDLPSLRVIGEGIDAFAIDEACVFAGSFRVPVQDRASFALLGAGYARDATGVYWLKYRVEGADPQSFHVPPGRRYGVDQSGCWTGARAQACLQ